MFVAVAYNFRHGIWAHQGGYEVALAYGLLAVVLAATGPGPWSIDYLLGLTWLHGAAWAGGALLIGMLGAQGPLALRRVGLKRDAAAETGLAR
jgi:putative oxidoreductase